MINPIDTFAKIIEEEKSIREAVTKVSQRTVSEYLTFSYEMSKILQMAFSDPVKALMTFLENHTEPLDGDIVDFEDLLLPRSAVVLAVAAVLEYAKMVYDNYFSVELDYRFKNQSPIPCLWSREGMGKTTFALALCRVLRGRDAVILANMAPITEPDEVIGEINAPKMYARSQQLAFLLNLASHGKIEEKVTDNLIKYDLSFENPALWDIAPLLVGAIAGISVTGDEIGRMSSRALDGLMSANISTYTIGGRVIRGKPGHFVICTANPKREGEKHFTKDIPQQKRFLLVNFDYEVPLESLVDRIKGSRAATLVRKAIEMARKKNILINPRQVFYFMKLAKYSTIVDDETAFLQKLVDGMVSEG